MRKNKIPINKKQVNLLINNDVKKAPIEDNWRLLAMVTLTVQNPNHLMQDLKILNDDELCYLNLISRLVRVAFLSIRLSSNTTITYAHVNVKSIQ